MAPISGTTTGQGVGRPRDERVDVAIRQATLELLSEVGYNQLSIEAVARRAGTTKRTIYRRWPSKAHLVHEVVFPIAEDAMPAPTGDLAVDLRQVITGALRSFSRAEARSALPGLMAEFWTDPALYEVLTNRLERQTRSAFHDLLDAGVKRGAVRKGVNPDVVFDMVAGTALFTVQTRDGAARDELVDHIVNLILRAIER